MLSVRPVSTVGHPYSEHSMYAFQVIHNLRTLET
jgi:hypothetical protein